jgi:hypothetical protein
MAGPARPRLEITIGRRTLRLLSCSVTFAHGDKARITVLGRPVARGGAVS